MHFIVNTIRAQGRSYCYAPLIRGFGSSKVTYLFSERVKIYFMIIRLRVAVFSIILPPLLRSIKADVTTDTQSSLPLGELEQCPGSPYWSFTDISTFKPTTHVDETKILQSDWNKLGRNTLKWEWGKQWQSIASIKGPIDHLSENLAKDQGAPTASINKSQTQEESKGNTNPKDTQGCHRKGQEGQGGLQGPQTSPRSRRTQQSMLQFWRWNLGLLPEHRPHPTWPSLSALRWVLPSH